MNGRKIRFLAILIATLLPVSGLFAQGSADGFLYVYPSDPSAKPGSGSLLGGFTGNATLNALLASQSVISYSKAFDNAPAVVDNAYEIHLNGDRAQLQADLAATGLFSLVEHENYFEIQTCPETCDNPETYNDPNIGYEVDLTGMACAHTITTGDPSVVVGVVDTRFDVNHPDLQGQYELPIWGNNSPTNNDHGVYVSGMIAAIPNNGTGTAGIAPGSKVAGYVVGNGGSVGNPWPAVWAAFQDGRPVISVSWTGVGSPGGSSTAANLVQFMVDQGTILVVAAGNSAGQSNHSTYADIPGVINVGAVRSDGSIQPTYTYNQWVDLTAPGRGVGCLAQGNRCWGSSLSAPLVAGVAALMLSVNPCLSPSEVEDILKATACPHTDETPFPGQAGAGYLNAYGAVKKAKGAFGNLTSNTLWDEDIQVTSTVTVKTGNTLTITAKASFAKNARLIVERGAKLIVEGGTLTRACDEFWRGISVHGNTTLPQPDASSMPGPQEAGIVVLRNATIEYARTAISTRAPGMPYADQRVRWGGLIDAKNSFFLNNKRAVEFMKYDFENKSRFFNCLFKEEGFVIFPTTGVTIWACNGIEFNNNSFEDLDRSGISGIDYGADIINGNDFINLDEAIVSRATAPYQSFVNVDGSLEANYFENNRISIYSNSTNQLDGLVVKNNEFFEGEIGVWVEGDARFTIVGNSFFAQQKGVMAVNTGIQHNYVDCNYFQQMCEAIQVRGWNRQFQFRTNTFQNTGFDLNLQAAGSNPGQIRRFQGSAGAYADNCFADNNTEDINTGAGTVNFYYFKPIGALPNCKIPTNDQCSGGSMNYCAVSTGGSGAGCSNGPSGVLGSPPFAYGDLLTVRSQVNTTYASWQADPLNTGKEVAYEDALESKDEVLNWLVSDAVDAGNYSSGEFYLAGEVTPEAGRQMYGLKLQQGDLTAASTLLAGLPTTTIDEVYFRDVQQINLTRLQTLQAGSKYEYTPSDLFTLETVSASDSYLKGFADGLLSLEKDLLPEGETSGDFPCSEIGTDDGESKKTVFSEELTPEAPVEFLVYPNPARSQVSVQMEGRTLNGSEWVQLVDLQGKVIARVPMKNTVETLSVSDYPQGLYFLQVVGDQGLLFTDKLVVRK